MIREICNVVFRASKAMKIGTQTFSKGQPVLFLDTAKTSTLEGSATSVYATGGRGNTRLVAWEGEKVLTFTVEDALLSPISFSMLSGAGVVKGADNAYVHVHMTTAAMIQKANGTVPAGLAANTLYVDLSGAIGDNPICSTAPIFIMKTEGDGSITGTTYEPATVSNSLITFATEAGAEAGTTVLVDYYIKKVASHVTELQIDAAQFGGYFYVEADTLFRAQIDGKDYPANITFPNVKIQSNWTFSMAATGDPSTFTFTMDAMPGYTYFDKTKKVLCVIQVVEDADDTQLEYSTVMGHDDNEATQVESEEKVPYDNVPNTTANRDRIYASKDGYTKLTARDTYNSETTYYKPTDVLTSAQTRWSEATVASASAFATEVASERGLYTKNA